MLELWIQNKMYKVDNLPQAQSKWVRYTKNLDPADYVKLENPDGVIIDTNTGKEYYITYNARIWDKKTDKLVRDYSYKKYKHLAKWIKGK